MPSVSSTDNTFNKDMFLRLFTTQARMQNPMNPTDSADFLAQLAQFSSLEQMSNLNTNMEKLLGDQKSSRAYQLIGKEVTYLHQSGQTYEGRVLGVSVHENQPKLIVGNSLVPLEGVLSVFEPAQPEATTAGLLEMLELLGNTNDES